MLRDVNFRQSAHWLIGKHDFKSLIPDRTISETDEKWEWNCQMDWHGSYLGYHAKGNTEFLLSSQSITDIRYCSPLRWLVYLTQRLTVRGSGHFTVSTVQISFDDQIRFPDSADWLQHWTILGKLDDWRPEANLNLVIEQKPDSRLKTQKTEKTNLSLAKARILLRVIPMCSPILLKALSLAWSGTIRSVRIRSELNS